MADDSLAGSVIQGAQAGVADQGHTVGDAMQAYHIAATAEHARQELNMEKQNQDMNKATWVMNSMAALGKVPPGSQPIAVQSFTKQLQQVYPDANPDIVAALQKDEEFRQQAIKAASLGVSQMTGGRVSPQGAQSVAGLYQGDLAGAAGQFDKILQQDALIKSSQMKNEAMNGRVAVQRDNQTINAGKAFEANPILRMSKTSLNSLNRSSTILENPDRPVTSKDLNLAYNDYINAVAAGGAATEGKIARELPDTFEQQWNELKMKAGDISDLRKDPTGLALIKQLQSGIHSVKGDLGNAISDEAENVNNTFKNSDNPKVVAASQAKLQEYKKYSKGGGAGPVPGAAAPGAPAPTPMPNFEHMSDADLAKMYKQTVGK